MPFPSTNAPKGLLLLHDPPGVPLLTKVIAEPLQTDEGPLIVPALAAGLTFILKVVLDVPQVFVTK